MSTWKELANDMPDWVNMEEQAANLAAAILILMDNLLAALPESPERTRLYNVRKVFFKDRKFSSNFRKLIPNEEGAAEIVEKLLQFARQFCKDTKSLRHFWSENKQLIDILDSNFPVQYEVLKTGFTELKSKYEGATNNG